MRTAILSALAAGCAYPDFAFVADAPEPKDSMVSVDATDVASEEEPQDSVAEAAPETPGPCAACTASERCIDSVCRPFEACAPLKSARPGLPSGVYTIDPDGAGPIAPFATYCEQVEDGGGWTLALKLDGAKKTFAYDAALWTNEATLAPTATALDSTEAKLASFSTVPFKSLRAAMLQGGVVRSVVLPLSGSSLRSMFAGAGIVTTVGRAGWLKLLSDPRLQANCNAEGVNQTFSAEIAARARLGILGNNEMDCSSPDSYVAFGAGFVAPHMCVGAEPGVVVGNFNPLSCGGSAGNERATAVFGYLFIR